MPIRYHPKKGSIIRCDYSTGFTEPEMVKRRPVLVLSPDIQKRPQLCTVVALSTTPPDHIMPYHMEITLPQYLPRPYHHTKTMWVKGDMINTVAFHRLELLRYEKNQGKRTYYLHALSAKELDDVYACVLRGLGLSCLTKHLPSRMIEKSAALSNDPHLVPF